MEFDIGHFLGPVTYRKVNYVDFFLSLRDYTIAEDYCCSLIH